MNSAIFHDQFFFLFTYILWLFYHAAPEDYELLINNDIIITSSTNIYCIDLAITDDLEPEPGKAGLNFTLTVDTNDTFVMFTNHVTTVVIHDNDGT